jgi:hypothetical protein
LSFAGKTGSKRSARSSIFPGKVSVSGILTADVDTTVARMLDLYFIPHNVVLRQLAFSVVYENKEIGRNPFSALFMARVGVGFTTMASSCQSLLEEILSAFSNEDRPEHSFPVARHVPRYSSLKAF